MTNSSSPLRFLAAEPGFRRLWIATAISELGSIVSRVAFLLLVHERAVQRGDSAPESATALMLVAETIAMVLFGPIAGALVDRFDRRTLLVVTNLIQFVLVGSVPFAARLDATWPIYALAMAISGLSTIFPPARQSAIPDLVGLERAPTANAISSSTTSFVIVLGAAVTAVVLEAADKDACFWFDSASFLLAAIAISGLVLPRHSGGDGVRAFFREIAGGLAYVRRTPPIAYVVLCYFVSFLFIGLWLPIMPEYLRRHVGVDPDVWLPRSYLAFGIGGILGGMIGPWIGRNVRVGRSIVLMFFLEPLMMAVYGFPVSATTMLALSFVWGLIAFAYFVQEHTVLQQDVPPELRGRVFGMLPPLQALGTLTAAALVLWEAGRIEPGNVMFLAGIGYFAASALFLFAFRGGLMLWRRPNLGSAST